MSNFTPGPWAFGKTCREDQRLILGRGGKGKYICNVQIHQTPRSFGTHEEPEREANAHLIAAAPELLEALTAAVAAIDKGGLDDVMCCNGWECGCRAATNGELLIHDLRVVIAKATGGAA